MADPDGFCGFNRAEQTGSLSTEHVISTGGSATVNLVSVLMTYTGPCYNI